MDPKYRTTNTNNPLVAYRLWRTVCLGNGSMPTGGQGEGRPSVSPADIGDVRCARVALSQRTLRRC